MKDNFSHIAEGYRQYRPTYPPELYDFLLKHTTGRGLAWDCGTGNGQVAASLADYFQRVEASDISEAQLDNAPRLENVHYHVSAAHVSLLEDKSVDLITAGQALHWFNFDLFYEEVRRVLKPETGLFAAWCYTLLETDNPEFNEQVRDFYSIVIGPYWDPERYYIDEMYQTIPFPFEEIVCPEFWIKTEWTSAQVEGYLSTWSAVKHYKQARNHNPVPDFMKRLADILPSEQVVPIRFPVYMRAGRV